MTRPIKSIGMSRKQERTPALASSSASRCHTTVSWNPEGVPCYRGIGVRRVQDLPLVPWKRLGGRGSFIQLFGTEGLWGMLRG